MASNNLGAISQLSGLFGSDSQSNMTPGVIKGSNQYMNYPIMTADSMSSGSAPGTVPTPPSLPTTSGPSNTTNVYGTGNTGAEYAYGGDVPYTNSQHIVPTEDPTLTQQFYNMLAGQAGQGLPTFNLSTLLPSSGQATQAGQLNAPLNNVYQQLQNFLTGGSSTLPGASAATSMAQTGNPIDQTAAWQSMIAAQQANTAQNANNLREQFAFAGDLKSSPFANTMQNFYNQNALNQNAQLTQATATAQENAANRELSAQQDLQGLAAGTGQELQTIDQNAINQLLQEFNYTLPQNNPLLPYESQAATFIPTVAGTPTTAQNFAGILSAIGSLF